MPGLKKEFDESILRKTEWSIAIAATLASVILHFMYMRHAGGLWRDEIGTLDVACLPSLREVWHYLYCEAFPISWMLVLRVWCALGLGGDGGLRFLGFLSGLSVLGALWFNARCLKLKFPLFSLLLVGFNPVQIIFGDSTRAWGWGIFWILVTYGLIWKLVESPTKRNVIAAALASIMAVQATYYNAVLLFAICVAGMLVASVHRQWKTVVIIPAIGVLAAISLIPYVSIFAHGNDYYSFAQLPFHWGGFVYKLSGAMSGVDIFGNIIFDPGILKILWWGAILFLIAMAFPSVRSRITPAQMNSAIFGLTAGILAVACYFTFLHALKLVTNSWYYLPLLAVIATSLDAFFAALGNWERARLIRLTVIVMLVWSAIRPVAEVIEVKMTNVDVVARRLNAQASRNDLILVSPWYLGITFQRYFSDSAQWSTVPSIEEHRFHRYDVVNKLLRQPDQKQVIQNVLDRAVQTLRSGNNVWLVGDFKLDNKGREPAQPVSFSTNTIVSFERNSATLDYWLEETAYTVQSHATHYETNQLSISNRVSVFETIRLVKATGWQEKK